MENRTQPILDQMEHDRRRGVDGRLGLTYLLTVPLTHAELYALWVSLPVADPRQSKLVSAVERLLHTIEAEGGR